MFLIERNGIGRLRAGVVCLCVASLSGCALFNPHVRAPELDAFRYSSQGGGEPNRPNKVMFAGDLPAAIDAAEAQRRVYTNAAEVYSVLRNTTPIVLTGMGATGLYLGITYSGDNTTRALTALGIGAASLLGLSTYLDNRPRQQLYYSASLAIGCAITATRPLLLTQADYDRLVDGLTDLDTALFNAEVAGARAIDTTNIIAAARVVQSGGREFRRLVDLGGAELIESVRAIKDKVDAEIAKTTPDIASSTQLIAALGPTATRLVPTPPVVPPELARGRVTPQSGSPEALLGEVAAAAAIVSSYVDTAAALERVAKDLEDCKPPVAENALTLRPDVDQIVVEPPQTVSFVVSGGTGIPTAAFAGVQPADAKVTPEFSNGGLVFNAVFGPNASGTGSSLVFSDGSGRATREVKVTIAAPQRRADAGSTGAGIRPADTCPADASERDIPRNRIEMLQREIGAPVDGVLGCTTREKLKSYPLPSGRLLSGRVPKDLLDEIGVIACTKAIKEQPSATEQAIAQTRINQARQQLGLAPDGIDAGLRAAAWNVQWSKSELPINGRLTEKTIDEILNFPVISGSISTTCN
jgi:hypothetical protein